MEIKALETVAEGAKEFLQKVVTPPLGEIGLLIADQVKYWRFKNQVTILNKAEKYLKDRNFNTRKVSLKVLTPLLEGSAMEEDENMQEKWAILLANTIKEGSEINTTLFSHILTQLSSVDATILEQIFISTTTTTRTVKTVMIVHNDMSVSDDAFNKEPLSIDNLVRLRLLKEPQLVLQGGTVNPFLSLTNLGFSFMLACRKE